MKNKIIFKEGIPTLIIVLLLTIIFYLITPLLSILGIGLIIFVLYFFRDPKRVIVKDEEIILSPADGIVTNIEEVEEEKFIKQSAIRISIFMSPVDVHINRSPIPGVVDYIEYKKGKFKYPKKPENQLINEKNYIGIKNNKIKILIVQIAGVMARRIINWTTENQKVEMGDKIGMIKFSSGTQIYLPKETEILIKEGDRVVSGITHIGRY